MTLDRDRHDLFEELISASLSGDIGDEERRQLDEHLDGCERCRTTLAAFADGRRIMAGLRHVAPPRDLSARVRTGIQQGAAGAVPWWRRPPAIFAGIGGGLAAVAGALLALVLLNGPGEQEVGQPSMTATPVATTVATSVPTPVPTSVPTQGIPTLPPVETAAPSVPGATPVATPVTSPAPTATPVDASPEPDSYVAVTGPFDNLALTVRDGGTGETEVEPAATPGAPIAAELSPDGQWISFITERGLSGQTQSWATRVADPPESPDPSSPAPVLSEVPVGETIALGDSIAGGPFVRHLAWSSDSRFLSYTLIDPEGNGTDVWILDAADGSVSQLTDVGNALGGSWVPGESDPALLWISTVDEEPRSRLVSVEAGAITAGDPDDSAFPAVEDAFQPLVSPNGAFAIYWTGRMAQVGDEWQFVEGGAPWLANHVADGEGGFELTDGRSVFSGLVVDRDAFSSAAITWSIDSDAYAVWDARWTGSPQSAPDAAIYPDPARVYFGHATDPRGITATHAIDASDIPEDASVVDVKAAPTGRHLAITVRFPLPGALVAPDADLLLVTRNTGTVADEVISLREGRTGWFGPAVYERDAWLELLDR